MAGWLPEGFQGDEKQMERSVSAVSGRIVRRKARVRLTKQAAMATLAFALVAGGAFLLRPTSLSSPTAVAWNVTVAGSASATPAELHAAATNDAPPVPVAAAWDAAVAGSAEATTPVIPRPPLPVVPLRTLRGTSDEGSIAGSRISGRDPGTEVLRSAPRVTKERKTPDLPVTLAKVDHSVAVNWEGNSGEEFEVYRCESPTFETCSLAGRVSGTSWVDPDLDGPGASGTITYYKVVLRSGA